MISINTAQEYTLKRLLKLLEKHEDNLPEDFQLELERLNRDVDDLEKQERDRKKKAKAKK